MSPPSNLFTQITPTSISLINRCALLRSLLQTPAANPAAYFVKVLQYSFHLFSDATYDQRINSNTFMLTNNNRIYIDLSQILAERVDHY